MLYIYSTILNTRENTLPRVMITIVIAQGKPGEVLNPIKNGVYILVEVSFYI